jgi:AsmA family
MRVHSIVTNIDKSIRELEQDQLVSMTNESAPTSKRRRRWPYIAAASGVLVIFIFLLIPTIASFGPARSYVLSKINAKLQGKLQIKSWSLGWGSGFRATDVTLSDKKGAILTIQRVSTGLTLRQILRGDYALGNVVLDGLHFDIQVDENGKTNLQRAIESGAHAQSAEVNAQQAQSGARQPGNSALPNVSANITLTNIAGTITRPGSPPAEVTVQGSLNIPNINQPIDNDLSATLQSGSARGGSITCKGQVSVVANNRIVDVAKMDIQEHVSLKNIELSALSPFLPVEKIDTLSGLAGGDLEIMKYPLRGLVADGELRAENVTVSGPALRGDTYSTNTLDIKIPGMTIAPDQFVGMLEPIQIQFDQGGVSLTARGPVSALQNLSGNQAPGGNGLVSAECHVDFAALSRQLPHTLDLRAGLALSSAQIVWSGKIKMTADSSSMVQHLELSHISGTDDGQAIAFSPITVDSSATILPSRGPVPILHDLSVKLASDFASADFHGGSLADFGGSGKADLAVAQRQLAQIFDFHNWQLQGLLNVTLACQGNLADPSAPIQIDSRLQADNLNIAGGIQAIHEPSATAVFSGKIIRDASDSITDVNNLKLALQTNENGHAVTACTADGSLRLHPGRSDWRMIQEMHLRLDLPDLPRTVSLVEAMQVRGVEWISGRATVEINLTESDGTLGGDTRLSATDLAFARGSHNYHFEPMQFAAAGRLMNDEIDVRQFAGSVGTIADVQLIQPVVLKNAATPMAQGEIRLIANLAKVSELANAWNDAPTPQTLSGQLVMDQAFSTDGSNIAANGNGTVTDLTVGTEGQTQFHEKELKITNDLVFDSSAQSVTFNSCSIAMPSSHALDAALTGAIRHLSTTRDFDHVRVMMSYDLASLLRIVAPLLSASDQEVLAEYSITGVQKHTIAITGNFPADQSLDKSLRRLDVVGSVGIDQLQGNGITLINFSPAFTLRDGVFTITDTPNAVFNGGKLDLAGISFDLADPAQRVSAPPGLHVVSGSQLNAVLLGKYGADLNPLLSNPQQAAGVLDLTLEQCDRFSLAQFNGPLAPGTSPGSVKVIVSVKELHMANDMTALIAVFAPRAVLQHQLVGNVNNATFAIQDNIVASNMKLVIGPDLSLGFHGNINLRTQELDHFVLDFPTPMIADVIRNPAITQFLPTEIPIAIKGTTSHYSLDTTSSFKQIGGAIAKLGGGVVKGVKGVIGDVGNTIKKQVDQNKQSQGNPNDSSQQSDPNQKHGVKGFFNNLLGK